MSVTYDKAFFKNVDQEPVLDPAVDTDKTRPRRGSQAQVKWLGGPPETGPWVYWVKQPAGARVAPHKHHAARVEYVLDGEIEFFEGDDAIAWYKGEREVQGSRHGPGSMSFVPSGQVYGYLILSEATLLHVFYSNPVGHTDHVV